MAFPKLNFTMEDVVVSQAEPIHQGFFDLNRYRLRNRLFAGDWSPLLTREVFDNRQAVCVLLYDPTRQQIVLVEQFRAGLLASKRESSPWTIEIVAGMRPDNELPADVAKREALEEAKLAITKMLPICEYYPSPGSTAEYVYLFCGKVDAGKVTELAGLASEHEDIRVHVVTFDDAFSAIKNGEIKDGPSIIALQWLALNKDRVE